MAFTDPFDVLTPPNTEGVTNGDDRIREFKRAMNERLLQLITGWPDVDPLKLKDTALHTKVDLPAVPSGVATNIAAVPGGIDALYKVTVQGYGLASTQISTAYIAASSNNTFNLFGEQKPGASQITITNGVGGMVVVTQTSGVAMNVRLTYFRLA